MTYLTDELGKVQVDVAIYSIQEEFHMLYNKA
jgi:hypothetical protein